VELVTVVCCVKCDQSLPKDTRTLLKLKVDGWRNADSRFLVTRG